MTEDLTAWLLEQIDERERTIRRAGPDKLGWATYRRPNGEMDFTSPVAEAGVAGAGSVWVTAGQVTEPDSVLVVFDPVVELEDLAAKRRIVAEHSTPHTVVDGFCVDEGGPCTHVGEDTCARCGHAPCTTIRLLALSCADHEGYREEWRP